MKTGYQEHPADEVELSVAESLQPFDVLNALQVDIGKEEVKVALLAALLLPLRALESKSKTGTSVSAVRLIVRDSMKWKKTYASLAAELQIQAPELLKVHQTLQVRPTRNILVCQQVNVSTLSAAADAQSEIKHHMLLSNLGNDVQSTECPPATHHVNLVFGLYSVICV